VVLVTWDSGILGVYCKQHYKNISTPNFIKISHIYLINFPRFFIKIFFSKLSIVPLVLVTWDSGICGVYCKQHDKNISTPNFIKISYVYLISSARFFIKNVIFSKLSIVPLVLITGTVEI